MCIIPVPPGVVPSFPSNVGLKTVSLGILNEAHLRRVLEEHAHTYFNEARPHQGVGQRIPGDDGVGPPDEKSGEVVAVPVLGCLHHDYGRAA